ncbi:DUF6519 domain-containing protein [Streptomyces griseoruber]|uniref:Uncharacterized protein n=1 Tax=Streptomyces griseoruber TaxID=1943 RepID=A0A101T400_9ACTN|nr:DUF6519 domain-containing protein [Streptomyces griseoruber]KUN85417.1 hypothetical protein AQJ64_11955 [Streptomyces griseoruber]
MHGDFSRLTYRPQEHYAAVVSQQGRVLLDAESNEQAQLGLSADRSLAADLIGRHGGPGDGFRIEYGAESEGEKASLTIAPGRYYVDGIAVDATRPEPLPAVDECGGRPADAGHAHPDAAAKKPVAAKKPASAKAGARAVDGTEAGPVWTYWDQPYAYRDVERDDDELPSGPFLAYLRVHDRLVTAVQDPLLRETALGAALPDTTARVRVDWEVLPLELGEDQRCDPAGAFDAWVAAQQDRTCRLAARAERPARVENDPCLVAPDARYRGPENQLYRVEIHRGGEVGEASYKWSRENGSVVLPLTAIGEWVTLEALGRDDKLDLDVGDFVEVCDDASVGRGEIFDLLQVVEVDLAGRRVRLSAEPDGTVGRQPGRHPYLRRWDQLESRRRGAPRLEGGAVKVVEGEWIDLEDGVQVYFAPCGRYVSGDYWTFAARTVTGAVEWPTDAGGRPLLARPAGVAYHYAPLAWINDGQAQDLRKVFGQLTA